MWQYSKIDINGNLLYKIKINKRFNKKLLLLRSYNNFPKVINKDIVVSNWRADGLRVGKTLEILKEYYEIKLKNKLANKSLLIFFNWSYKHKCNGGFDYRFSLNL